MPPHVTLLPPTPLGEESLEQVEEHLRKVAESEQPFVVHLRGSGTFRPVSPVVFVPLARGISECERVEEQVRSGPLARETAFPYHPHVTVAHDLDEASVLVVDDVADTGRTLELVAEFCSGHVRDLQTAVLYEKPQSVITCDHVWKRTSRWINFPWSVLPTVVAKA